jgi:hypothetical protein
MWNSKQLTNNRFFVRESAQCNACFTEDTLYSVEACLHRSINHDHFNHSETQCVSFPYLVSSLCHFALNICVCNNTILKFSKEFYCQSCIAGISFISVFDVWFLPSYFTVCPGSRLLSFL